MNLKLIFLSKDFGFLVATLLMIHHCNAQLGSTMDYAPVINFEKKWHGGGNQSWKIKTDKKGFTWIANNAGVLRTDGTTWTLLPSPNGTINRSLDIDEENQIIYVGFQGEFGFFQLDVRGKYQYQSLVGLLSNHYKQFSDVWDVIHTKDGTFFRTDNMLFQYHHKKLSLHALPAGRLNFMGIWHGKLTVQDVNNALFQFVNGSFVPKSVNGVFDKGRITAVLPFHADTTLITTIDGGIFYESAQGFKRWITDNDAFLIKNIIFCATLLPDKSIALGTSFNGMAIIDKSHRLSRVVTKNQGLQNNSVLSIGYNLLGQVWLGLDKGIDLVDINTPFSSFFPDGELQGTIYATVSTNEHVYFGTNTGLYATQSQSMQSPFASFFKIANSGGQVWSLSKLSHHTVMGHHNGAYSVHGSQIQKLDGPSGVWRMIDMGDGYAIAGTYSGLYLYKIDRQQISLVKKIRGFDESARILYKDSLNQLWIAHPYRGIYCYQYGKANGNFVNLTQKYPLLKKMIYSIDGQILVADDQFLYKVNVSDYTLTKENNISLSIDDHTGIDLLMQDSYGKAWVMTKNEAFFMEKKNRKWIKYQMPILKDKMVPGFQMIYSLDAHRNLICTDKGVLSFDVGKYIQSSQKPMVFLSKAMISRNVDTTIYLRDPMHVTDMALLSLKYDDANIRLTFGVGPSDLPQYIQYSHILSGSDLRWSDWSFQPTINYNKLKDGDYKLIVKSKTAQGIESDPYIVDIIVSPPWYRSWQAYLCYSVMALLSLQFLYQKNKKRHALEKSKLRQKNEALALQAEKDAQLAQAEIIRLQNEKLKNEIQFKNKELTSYTYNLVEKNELIHAIQSLVSNLEKKVIDHPEIKKELKQIQKLTTQNQREEEEWATFISSFDEVHADFFKRLNAEFKDLSPTDYKMCTYLRMNLTSKEIASLMNISIRSVETNRYRLRKKLNLSSDVNLTHFIMMY